MISLFSERAMWFPFLNFVSEKNGEIVFQKFLSCFEHLSPKYLRIEYFRILTTKFLRRLFSSQQDFPYFLNLFLAMFLRYWVFRRTEFIYDTDCDETVLLLTGAWWSTTYLTRELVYHAMSSMSSKISIVWNGAYSRSTRKSDSINSCNFDNIWCAASFRSKSFCCRPYYVVEITKKKQRAFRVDIYLRGYVP